MQLISVNVSLPKEVPYNGGTLRTGIYKEAVGGRVQMHTLHLEGDGQADLKNHGGTYKAVYFYPYEHYAYWAEQLNRDDFVYGQFGENLTVTGLMEDEVQIGDVLEIGSTVVQVTQPRVPCFKIAHKMGISSFTKTMHNSLRCGFYVRVLQEGTVGAGDAITRTQRQPDSMTVREIFHLRFFDQQNVAAAQKAAQIEALTPSWREDFAGFVEKYR